MTSVTASCSSPPYLAEPRCLEARQVALGAGAPRDRRLVRLHCAAPRRREPEGERAADPGRALHAQVAAHEAGQAAADRQAEAGAADRARVPAFHLVETARRLALLLGRDADAGVRDRTSAQGPSPRRCVAAGGAARTVSQVTGDRPAGPG
jgi:hypothetical protein